MKIMKFFIMLLSIVALGSCSNELVEMDSVESAMLSTSLEENVIIDSVSVEEDSVRVYHVSKSDFPIAIKLLVEYKAHLLFLQDREH